MMGAIVVCLHGNEQLGLRIRDALEAVFPSFLFVTGNPLAVAHNVRYIDSDLNRSFNGTGKGYEAIRAATLRQLLSTTPFVIDIHTTTARTDHFAIIVNTSPLTRRLIAACPLAKVVLMTPALSRGGALIEHVPGISLEFACDVDVGYATEVVRATLENLASGAAADGDKELYEGFGLIEEGGVLENFVLYPKSFTIGAYVAPEEIYPVLSGEVSYRERRLTCIAARRVYKLPSEVPSSRNHTKGL